MGEFKTKSNLENVIPWSYICHVNPLTVNVMAIGVPAAHRNALITHVVAGEPLLDSCGTYKYQLIYQ